jgi:parallel beta-helix repeat protein
MCVSVLIFLLLFHFGSSQLVQFPYSSVDDFYSKDQIFPKLEVNDKDTLEAEFKVLNPLLQEIDVEKSSLNVLEIDFDKVCGDVIDYTFQYKTNCTKEIKTPVLKKIEICGEERGELYAKDGSYKDYECWQETDKLPIGVRDYKIKVLPKISNCGDSWGYKIDWIPTLKTTNSLTGKVSELTKEEWAWFNSTWDYRNMLNVSHIDRSVYNASVKVKLNTTNFNYSLANTTGKDIRFALDNGTLLDHYIQTWNTSGESRIWVRMPYLENGTNTTIYIYYGNSEATSTSNMTNVFGTGLISFWDFDNNDLDVWAQNNGTLVSGTAGYNLSSSGEVNGSRAFYGKSAGAKLSLGSNSIDVGGPPLVFIASINPLGPAGTYTQGGNYPMVISEPNNGWGIVLSHDSDGNRAFLTKVGVNGLYDVGAFPKNEWSNLAVKYNTSNKVYFYWNGSSNSNSAYSSTFSAGINYLMGGRGTLEFFNGSIDYIKVYNREMSDNEINNLSLVYEPTISYFGDMENGTTPEPAGNLTGCAELNVSGLYYNLTTDILNSNESVCMNITGTNITLDCHGHTIEGVDADSSNAIAIMGNYSNPVRKDIIIKNCIIKDFFRGIRIYGSTYVTAINNSFVSQDDSGISMVSSRNNQIINNTFDENYMGVYISITINSNISNNIITDSVSYGIYGFANGSNVLINNNYLNNTNNTRIFSPNTFKAEWNTTNSTGQRIDNKTGNIGGNYWATPNGTGFSQLCTDANEDGFCDEAYTLAENNIDYLPLYYELDPSEVWFGAYDVGMTPITSFNITINGITKNNSIPFMLKAGAYNATFSKEGWMNQTIEINVTALSNSTFNFTGLYNSIINFIASKYITDEVITDFYVTINNVTKPSSDYWYVLGGDYIATFSKVGWFNKSIDIHVVNGSSETYTFTDIYDKIWMIYAVDLNGNNLTEFEVNLSNSEYSWLDMQYTYVGVVDVAVLSELDYNLSFASVEDGGYLPRTYLDQSTASDFVAELHQAEIRFNLTEIDSGTPLTSVLINNVLSNLTGASSTSSTWSITKVFQTNATLVPYAISTLRMDNADYSAELIHEFFYNDSSKVNTSTLSTSSLMDVEYTILNPYPDKLVDTVNVWLRRNASTGTAYSNYTYIYSGDEYTGGTIYVLPGEQSFYFVNRPYFDLNYTIDVLALSNNTIDLEMYTNEIWLYGTRSHVLENFTCTYEGKVMYSNPYRISNILTPASNMTCTKTGFKPATVSPSISTPANESFYLDEVTTTSFPIYIYDEITLANITNATLYVFGEEPYVFNWTSTNRTISINGSGVTGMLFSKDGYNNEEYYIDIGKVYGQIDVYMLPTNSSINASFNLQDRVNVPIGGGFIDIYKFYPELVSYVRVSTYRTDDNGNATIYWEADKFYKVNTREEFSDTMYEAIDFPFIPVSTKYNVKYGLTESEQNSAFVFLNMNYNLSYTVNGLNQTIFSLTFNDLSGLVVSACLNVIEQGVSRDITLCENCLTASAGEILCVVNESDYVNTLSAWGTFETSTTFSPKNTPRLDVPKDPQYLDLGAGGLFVTFILTATGLIAGLFISVPVGLMFLVATLILAMATGLFWMQISAIVSLAILILLIIFKR